MYTRKRRRTNRKTRGGDLGIAFAIAIVVGTASILATSFYLDAKDPEVQAELNERRNIAASQGRSTWGIM